jgi:phage tail sheath protein FI
MTEYLHPGVYVEEVTYRMKVIDGVATLVVGMLIGVAVSIAIERLRHSCNLFEWAGQGSNLRPWD